LGDGAENGASGRLETVTPGIPVTVAAGARGAGWALAAGGAEGEDVAPADDTLEDVPPECDALEDVEISEDAGA
jgi:hypothetical protein